MGQWGKSMCQLLNPFSCHPPFWLTHLSLSHQSTTTLKLLLISWDSYCWVVVSGRTISPCPHAHSTSGLSLHVGKEANNSILPFLHSFHPHAETVAPFSSHTGWDSSLFSSCSKLGSHFSSIHDVPMKQPFMISAVECWDRGYCFPYDLWFDVGSFSFWVAVAIIESFWPR